MVDTDWREILSFSQRELKEADKEKLCENLSWMEADDIELNFTDLKTLFRLAQDILKFKSEQVNNLLGQLETAQRKSAKGKAKNTYVESPKSTDSVIETLAHQEEVIKANKEIIQQLYADIAELEERKSKFDDDKSSADKDSESSRDALSEMEAVAQLENELTSKNRHIRKLLGDVKVLEEEDTELKRKVSTLKDKLSEATQLIENMTEQLFALNDENNKLKEILGNSEQINAQLTEEIESLRKELFDKEYNKENIYEEIKSKVQHWKNLIRTKKAEIEALTTENTKLKEGIIQATQPSPSPKTKQRSLEEIKIKEMQDKLLEASNEITQSANMIEQLKAENKHIKALLEETPDFSISDGRNESDESKERIMINKLKIKNKSLAVALQAAEEMLITREKELAAVTSELQLLKSDEGIEVLMETLKNKKRQLKFKNEGIKSLVEEVNSLNQSVDDLQVENESMRQKLNIGTDEKVPTKGILKKFRELEHNNCQLIKQLRKFENKLVVVELDNRSLNAKISTLCQLLSAIGCSSERINEALQTREDDDDKDVMPKDGGGEATVFLLKQDQKEKEGQLERMEKQTRELAEENEGLRKALQEMLDFLKDNSTTSSGVLALECPTLDAILQSMEARHSAGWLAPHMSAVMALRTAIGGKDALLTALHDARKETFEVMTQLNKESQKSLELQQKLHEVEAKIQTPKENMCVGSDVNLGEFGSWISEKDQTNADINDKIKLEEIVSKGNFIYEDRLRNGLIYFHNKFKMLFDKMTSIAIQAEDDKNQWTLQEEQYKAQIENFKSQITISTDDEDTSDMSPGIINVTNISALHRKCSYLEESYKYIRTLNENMKNEYLESKRNAMIATSEYEAQIQKLILAAANLTDKLRISISLELFWKQNEAYNEIVSKYRKIIENELKNKNECEDLFARLERDKLEVISCFQTQSLQDNVTKEEQNAKTMMSTIEQSIVSKQLQQLCVELDKKNKHIESLETKNSELQQAQSKLIDESLSSAVKEDVDLMNDQLNKLAEENKILKEQCQHVESQLDIALLQLQDSQQRQLSHDLEINMLRHQILDLQSTGDNKAIVARLSGEVLVAHLQASESHKKIERLSSALNKEKVLKMEAEEMLNARQKIFDVYTMRYEAKFKYMYEVMEVLRQQYQGSLPLTSIENYLNKVEDLSRKTLDVEDKLDEIEDLRSSLMTKHSVFNQILDLSKNNCLEDEDSCAHKLQNIMMKGVHSREMEHCNKKLNTLEISRQELFKRYNDLEKTLLQVNQGFEKASLTNVLEKRGSVVVDTNLELEDIQSDDDSSSSSKRTGTITLSKPRILKPMINEIDMTGVRKEDTPKIIPSSLVEVQGNSFPEVANVSVQTDIMAKMMFDKQIQTVDNSEIEDLNKYIITLRTELAKKDKEVTEAMKIAHERTDVALALTTDKNKLESTIQALKRDQNTKISLHEGLRNTIQDLKMKLQEKASIITAKTEQEIDENTKSLILALNKLENDKNDIVAEYKVLLNNEREEYSKSMEDMQLKIVDLQNELDRRGSENSAANADAIKDVISKYSIKVAELEDKCFKAQSELDGSKAEVVTYRKEMDRWKSLASERLSKMEHLNSQLEERHCYEVESYKAENEHWLSQLNDTQKEHMELRTRLTEQKTSYLKQLAEKDAQIEQMRTVIYGLKTQVMSMQTMISISDPSFDLSAIVEVDEGSDALSQQGSERLELKFDSSVDLQDDSRVASTTGAIWQEPIIDRLRREKQLTGKQNAMLRRQIKALAARERRARLDAQNLKNQVFRISSGRQVPSASEAALTARVAALHTQLAAARRDANSTVALWDKWKKAQQAADRWQARFEEKCQELKKLEGSVSLSRAAVVRLEKEKRLLLSRLNELKHEKMTLIIEKQDGEGSEKGRYTNRGYERDTDSEGAGEEQSVSARALLGRVEAQQRRIAALEIAEKGNEHLVSEYEKALAEITSLKGQVLKLESTLLEAQIKKPLTSKTEPDTELDYWKSYCEMLKEENVQLNLRASAGAAVGAAGAGGVPSRVADLEQTVLTLRGLVSKLQQEQKVGGIYKRPDSRPSSSRSGTEKGRSQLETYRVEIANLKRTINDKDQLLERSKDMLRIAAEREDDLLRENASLRRKLREFTNPGGGGFMSA